MMEFKVGDKLRYKGAKSCYYTKGRVYELREKYGDTFWLTDNESSEVANHEWDFEGLKVNFERIDELQFKVGDKVRVVNVDGIRFGENHYYDGFETEVICIDRDGNVQLLSTKGEKGVHISKREIANGVIELIESKPIESKPTKKQRITALEETVASLTEQLQALQQQVNARFEPSTAVVAVDGDTAALAKAIEEKPVKTANELRAEVIEKAKEFVIQALNRNYSAREEGISVWFVEGEKNFFVTHHCEFVCNIEKRTIVALVKLSDSNDVHHRGIAKCNPSDVFSSHIGKAIALGRALGLDVSEFENAVQPITPVVGMKVEVKGSTGKTYKANVITHDEYVRHDIKNAHEYLVKITDDTNAQYEVK